MRIGTAGWQLPAELRPNGSDRSALEKYAELFNAVEVNSTHYKQHLPRTYERWAASVPSDFRFAVKMHRDVTHVHRLRRATLAREFLSSLRPFGEKLGPVLIQLPPSLAYETEHDDLFEVLRQEHDGPLVLEPRHPSWSSAPALRMLKGSGIGVVVADPPLIAERFTPLFDAPLRYFRLHGSPVMYRSSYDGGDLEALCEQVKKDASTVKETYVIFDNTASGAAAGNALELMRTLAHKTP